MNDRVAAASAAWVWVPATASRVETDEYLVVRFPAWYEHPVQLLTLAPHRPLDVVLDEVVAGCRDAGLGQLLAWVKLDAPAGLEDELVARGAALDETLDVLARPVTADDLPALDPPGAADGVELRWVEDLATFRHAADVGVDVFGGTSPTDDELEREMPGEVDKLHDGGGGAVVAYLDDAPVGSAGLSVAASPTGADARLWGGGVRPAARGRGVYRALLDARLRYAVEHGCDLALVKGRVQTSGPILRRAGFAAFGQERSYRLDL